MNTTDQRATVSGVGTCTPPNGITPEEAERMAREADELRKEGR